MAADTTAGSVGERFRGLIMPIPTVFDGHGEVDAPAMEELTNWYVDRGVHGFFVLGSQGQGPACRIDQRKLVAETVIGQVNGRVPVVIQVGAVDPYTSIEWPRTHGRPGPTLSASWGPTTTATAASGRSSSSTRW